MLGRSSLATGMQTVTMGGALSVMATHPAVHAGQKEIECTYGERMQTHDYLITCNHYTATSNLRALVP